MICLQTIAARAAQLVAAANDWTSLYTYDELTEMLQVDVTDTTETHNLLMVMYPSSDPAEVGRRYRGGT